MAADQGTEKQDVDSRGHMKGSQLKSDISFSHNSSRCTSKLNTQVIASVLVCLILLVGVIDVFAKEEPLGLQHANNHGTLIARPPGSPLLSPKHEARHKFTLEPAIVFAKDSDPVIPS